LVFAHPATLRRDALMVCAAVFHERLTDVLAKHPRFGDQFIQPEIQDLQLIRRQKTG
jgi:hypothetical protein